MDYSAKANEVLDLAIGSGIPSTHDLFLGSSRQARQHSNATYKVGISGNHKTFPSFLSLFVIARRAVSVQVDGGVQLQAMHWCTVGCASEGRSICH